MSSLPCQSVFFFIPSDLQLTFTSGALHSSLFFVQVVDTPGIFDTELSDEEVIQQVAKSLIVTHPGLHALLYVVRVGARYTEEELKAYNRLKKTYGEDITARTIIILTHGDVLEQENLTLDDYKANASQELNTVLRECGNNCIVFNNKFPGEVVCDLMNMIQELGRGHFQSPYLASIQASVDSEVRRIVEDVNEDELKTVPNLDQMKRDEAARALEHLKKEVSEGRRNRLVATVVGFVLAGVVAVPVAGPAAAVAAAAMGGNIAHIGAEALAYER